MVQICLDDSASPMSSGTTQQRPTVPMMVIITSRGRTLYRDKVAALEEETNLVWKGTKFSTSTLSIPSSGTPSSTNSSFRNALPKGPLLRAGSSGAKSSITERASQTLG